MKVFFSADQFTIMVQPRVVAKLRKWIQSLKKKKKSDLKKKKSTAQRKPQIAFPSQVKITLVLSALELSPYCSV